MIQYKYIAILSVFLSCVTNLYALDREKIKDEFMNNSLCGWDATPGTATIDTNANGELVVKFATTYDWVNLSRQLYIDFSLHRYLSIKVNKYPEDGLLALKVKSISTGAEIAVYLADAVKTKDTDDHDIYTWDIKPLLDAKSINLVQKFELQMKCLNYKSAKSFVIDWVRSDYTDNTLPPIEPNLTNDITANQKTFLHFIAYGQSLSDGTQSYPSLSTENVQGNYMIGKQAWINRCNYSLNQLSPLRASMSFADVYANYFVANTTTAQNCEAPIIATVNHLQRKLTTKIPMIATSSGTGGKTIEQLSKEFVGVSKCYDDYLTTLHSMDTIMKHHNISVTCPALFWMQGEYNYYYGRPTGVTTNDKIAYKHLMWNLKNNMQSDVMLAYNQDSLPLFVTYQVGAQYINNFEQTISMAQLEASNENNDVICAGPVYSMPDRNGHLDPNGYRWYGEMLAKAFYKTAILKQPFKPLQPKRFVKESDNTIRIDFLVPEPPLVFDQTIMPNKTNKGFEIRENLRLKEINSVTIDKNSVRIVCATPFNGDIEIAYAGMSHNGEGNLRDSDPYQSYDTYINLNKKGADNQYVYPREPATASLAPQFEIRSLFDKKYPLYNFCVHFYYKIPAEVNDYKVPSLDQDVNNIVPLYNDENIYKVQSIDKNNIRIVSKFREKWRTLKIYDVNGRQILDTMYVDSINISSLKVGYYLIRVVGEQQIETIKFLKS